MLSSGGGCPNSECWRGHPLSEGRGNKPSSPLPNVWWVPWAFGVPSVALCHTNLCPHGHLFSVCLCPVLRLQRHQSLDRWRHLWVLTNYTAMNPFPNKVLSALSDGTLVVREIPFNPCGTVSNASKIQCTGPRHRGRACPRQAVGGGLWGFSFPGRAGFDRDPSEGPAAQGPGRTRSPETHRASQHLATSPWPLTPELRTPLPLAYEKQVARPLPVPGLHTAAGLAQSDGRGRKWRWLGPAPGPKGRSPPHSWGRVL